jgi:glycosyltransferase involved in cell wall biosynthesis
MTQDSSRELVVSVVVPCLNRAQFLVPTIESILQQDYPHIECIVADGGSTDGTQDILRRYAGKIKWLSEPDQGPPDAINKGWRMCGGQILAWLNADDVWAPAAVSTAVSYFVEHPEADVVYGDCGIIDQDGKKTSTVYVPEWDLSSAVQNCDYTIYQAASFLRRTILERVGWLWPNLCHDHELWLRISLRGGKLCHVPSLLAYARHHQENLGYCSGLVVPLKMEITKAFFENPDLPDHLLRLRTRATSNTYLRGVDYLFLDRFQFSRDIPRSLGFMVQALKADRSNALRVASYLFRLGYVVAGLFLKRYLPTAIYNGLEAQKRRLVEMLAVKKLFSTKRA